MSQDSNEQWEAIEGLEDDWNCNGAKPFSKEHIDLAKKFHSQLKPGYEIYPTARKSIQIEYEDKNEYIEFEVFEDGVVKMFVLEHIAENML